MKILSLALIFVLTAFHAVPAGAIVIGALDNMLNCDPTTAVPGSAVVDSLAANIRRVTNNQYQIVSRMRVNRDGEGTIGILFENGQPSSIRLEYTNSQGVVFESIKSFADIANGDPLVYENRQPQYRGRAIVLERGANFREGNLYNFNLRLRTSINPEEHSTHQIRLDPNSGTPRLSSSSGAPFNQIVISPGIRLLPPSWNGTFTNVEFRQQ